MLSDVHAARIRGGVCSTSGSGHASHCAAPLRRARVQRRHIIAAAESNSSAGFKLLAAKQPGENLDERILSGEFSDTGSTKEKLTRPLRKALAQDPTGAGRWLAKQLAEVGRGWRAEAAKRMPEARGDIREIVGQPVFVPLYKLYLRYGKIFRLSFGPKSFVVISDPKYAKQILATNAEKYSKGLLSEILEFVMGTGLIPSDGEVWIKRRRMIVPSLHKRYVANMVGMFGDCALHGLPVLEKAAAKGTPVELENYFSRLALDIIGKAVFNYDFDSLTHDDPVIQAVYTTLREAEYRSVTFVPYWNIWPLMYLVPRQRRCLEALKVINATLDGLIAKAKVLVDTENLEWEEEFLSEKDPSILHFLVAAGDEINSKQLRDDLMTLLIAGHETTAAVLTWTFHLLGQHPEAVQRIREEVDRVLGDRAPTVEDMKELRYTTRVINESMRLYPQPPVLIRRALQADSFDGYEVEPGTDFFISVWNLHRSPKLWEDPTEFRPERFGPLDGPIPNEVTEGFAYLPFGGGRRKCIGDQFALFESIVALSMLVRRFDFTPAPGHEVGMTTGATIHTTEGLWMNVKPRLDRPPSPPPRTSEAEPVRGAAAAAGARGCPMHAGVNGSNGAAGVNGSNGAAGLNGSNGASRHAQEPEPVTAGV